MGRKKQYLWCLIHKYVNDQLYAIMPYQLKLGINIKEAFVNICIYIRISFK